MMQWNEKQNKKQTNKKQTNKTYITAGTVPSSFICVVSFVGRLYISYTPTVLTTH